MSGRELKACLTFCNFRYHYCTAATMIDGDFSFGKPSLQFYLSNSFGQYPLLIPENPENYPENPDNPENPENPDNPENPENPECPENPDNPENMFCKKIPYNNETYSGRFSGYYGLVFRVFRICILGFPGIPDWFSGYSRFSGFSGLVF